MKVMDVISICNTNVRTISELLMFISFYDRIWRGL